jgi:p-methyltransferase
MSDQLDCLLIGYNDMSFSDHRDRMLARDPSSAERRIFMRDHARVAGRRLPYMDVINHYVNQRAGNGETYYHVGEVPNLAAVYLTSYLRTRGFSAEFVSLFAAERDRIAKTLAERRPRLVAITTTFYIMPWPVEQIVGFVRAENPDTKIVVGGPLVNNLVADLQADALREAFDWIGADYYVRESQGEETLQRLVRALRDGDEPSAVPNLYHRKGGTFRYTNARPESNALDECAIDWSLFSSHELGRVAQTRTARSCAYKCSFCDYPVRAGALALASIETVERELTQLARQGVQHVIFIEGYSRV